MTARFKISSSLVYCFLLLALPIYSLGQQSVLNGIVSIHNSKFETGQKQYVLNANVSDFFFNATPVFTSKDGIFTLIFVGVPEKQTVQINVMKDPLEVVNIASLSAVSGQRDTLKITMASRGKIAEYRRKIYQVGKTKAEEQVALQLVLKTTQLNELKKDNATYKDQVEKLQATIDYLEAQRDQIDQQAKDFASKFAFVDLDDAGPIFQAAYRYFQQGKIDSALLALSNYDFPNAIKQINNLHERSAEHKLQAKLLDSAAGTRYSQTLQSLNFKIELHKTRFEFDSISICYTYLTQLDPLNPLPYFEFAMHYAQQRHDSAALSNFEKALSLAKTDSLIAVIKTEKAIIYQNRSDFPTATRLMNEALKIQTKLFAGKAKADPSLVKSHTVMGFLQMSTNNYAGALQSMETALALTDTANRSKETKATLSQIYNGLGILGTYNNQYQVAGVSLLKSVEVLREQAHMDRFRYEPDLVIALLTYANYLSDNNENPKAKEILDECEQISQRLQAANEKEFTRLSMRVSFEKAKFLLKNSNGKTGLAQLRRVIAFTDSLAASDPETYQLTAAGRKEQLANQFLFAFKADSALFLFQQIQNVYKTYKGKDTAFESSMARNLNNIGFAFLYQGKYDSSIIYISQAESILLKEFLQNPGPLRTRLAFCYFTKGLSYFNKSMNDTAERYFSRALKLYNDAPETNAWLISNRASIYFNLGLLYASAAKYPEAEYNYGRAKSDQLKLLKTNDLVYMDLYLKITYHLGRVYSSQYNFSRARREMENAIAKLRDAIKKDPSQVPLLVSFLNDIAPVLDALHEFAYADTALSEAVSLQDGLAKKDTAYVPYLVTLLNNAASRNENEGHLEKAEGLFHRAIALQKSLCEKDKNYRPFYINLLANLGHCYLSRLNQKEGEKQIRSVLKDLEEFPATAFYPSFKANLLQMLATVEMNKRNYAESESLFNQSIDLLSKPDSGQLKNYESITWFKTNIANIHIYSNQFPKAETEYREMIAKTISFSKIYPERGISTLATLYSNFGFYFRNRQLYDSSLTQFLKALQYEEELVGLNSAYKSFSISFYATLGFTYNLKSDYKTADEYMWKAITKQRELPESESVNNYLQVLYMDYASMYKYRNAYLKSLSYVDYALSIQKKLVPLDQKRYLPAYMYALNEKGVLKETLPDYESAVINYRLADSLFQVGSKLQPIDSVFAMNLNINLTRALYSQGLIRNADTFVLKAFKYTTELYKRDSTMFKPNLANIYFMLGQLFIADSLKLFSKNAFRDAIRLQDKLIALDSLRYTPFMVTMLQNAALTHAADNSLDTANLYMDRAISIQESLVKQSTSYEYFIPILCLQAGQICNKGHAFDKALKVLDRGLVLQTKFLLQNKDNYSNYYIQLQHEYANTLTGLTRYNEAIIRYRDCEKKIEGLTYVFSYLRANVVLLYKDMAHAYRLTNNIQLAQQYLKKAFDTYNLYDYIIADVKILLEVNKESSLFK
jgi:tetratricopeptide (TPR) repeat protein